MRAEIEAPGCSCCWAWRTATGGRAAGWPKDGRLRVFPDEQGRFDRSLLDTGGDALVVSQFTLIADTAKGNRPSFTHAAAPEEADPSTGSSRALRELGVPHVATGRFGA